jgi:ribonuclease P protein component
MPRSSDIVTLKKRAAFLAAAASGKKWAMPGLVLQIRKRPPSETEPRTTPLRYGLTASKKVGGAVQRNRARRRLRALAKEILVAHAAPLHDYVLIARPATVTREPMDLRQDLITALKRLHLWQEKTC